MVESNKIKSILFIYHYLEMGGIETLIIRMANWFVNNNYNLTIILTKSGGELLKQLDSKICIEIIPNRIKFISQIIYNQRIEILENKNIDLIYTLNPESFWIGNIIRNSYYKNALLLVGVYHLKDYELYSTKYQRHLFDKLPDNLKLFMNESVKQYHELFIFKRKFINTNIWPLPINIPVEKVKSIGSRNPKKFKLVSIGRFVQFKTYNIYMIDVVKALIEKGYEVKYEFYGYGPLINIMKSKIKEYKLEDKITINGIISYEQIPKVLEDAFAFIGCGTSVLEASSMGVPSIAGIPYDNNQNCYGLIYNLPIGNVGEEIDNIEKQDIIYIIIDLFEADKFKYDKECQLTYEYSKRYGTDQLMKKFIEISNENFGQNHYLSMNKLENNFLFLKIILDEIRTKLKIRTRIKNIKTVKDFY